MLYICAFIALNRCEFLTLLSNQTNFSMKQVLLLMFMLFGCVSLTFGQKIVSGKVTDPSGETIIGANVIIKEVPAIGTITDINGMFELNIPANGTVLIISYTGYQTQEIDISGRTEINVVLDQGQLLDEIVVTALGISRSEKSVGYSVSKVATESLREKAEPDLLKTLQGKVPGVDIRTSQGAPGSATRIQIRGNSSFGLETQPLFIVDGVPYSNDQVTTSSQTSGGSAYGSGIAGLDPNDIFDRQNA